MGYFWGLQAGCDCSAGKSPSLGACDAAQKKEGCVTIPGSGFEHLSVVNGKKYCGRRSKSLDLTTMKRPAAKKAGEPYKCKDKGYSVCGDPAADEKEYKVFCVPEGTDCPLTAISFKEDGTIEGTHYAKDGPPVINVQLSEGGAPCIYNNESFNGIGKDKAEMALFPEGYYNKCKSIVYGSPYLSEEYFGDKRSGPSEHTFAESKLYKEVTSFGKVSEYQLLKDNKQDVLKNLKKVKDYQVEKLKEYEFKMYAKRYREWDASKCSYMNNQSEKVLMTPLTLQYAVTEVEYFMSCAYGLLLAAIVVIVLLVLELVYISRLKAEKAVIGLFNTVLLVRRALSLCLVCFWSAECYLINNFDAGAQITALMK